MIGFTKFFKAGSYPAIPQIPCALVLACLIGGPAGAQQVDLSLSRALEQALAGNPQLTAAEGRVEEARGQQLQAGLKPNPRLAVQSEDIRQSTPGAPFSFVNSTEDYAYVGQVFESGGKRGRRIDVASSVVHTTEFEQDLTRRQITGRVASAYWAAASSARTRDLLQEVVQTYEEDVRYSQNRVWEGVMAEADLMRIQLERDRTGAAALTASREAEQALVNLYRAMGKREFPPTRLTDSLETIGPVALPEWERVLQSRPEVQIARQTVSEAEANIRLQQANGKPDPQAFVGYKRNGAFDTLYAAVQIDLPIRNRNQGNIASAQARLRVVQANLQTVEANLKADVEAAVRAYQDGRKLLDVLPNAMSKAMEVERLTRAAYREGGVDLLRLLDVERSRIQAQVDYNRALADLHQSVINLYLAGGESVTGANLP